MTTVADMSSPVPSDGGAEVAVEIDIESSVADVWEALTSAKGLAGWMGEGSSVGERAGDDLAFADIATGESRRGRMNTVERERHLAYTWWLEGDPATESNVTITIEPSEVGTRVRVIESRPATIQPKASAQATLQAASMQAAWHWRLALLVVAAPVLVGAMTSGRRT